MERTALKLRIYGDPVLIGGVKQVEKITDEHRRILSEMARLMYETSGVGLAAPQIGIDLALIVVDGGDGLYKLVNPKITKKEGQWSMEEGCLSIPGVGVKVKRAKKITLEALDESGKPLVLEAEDMLACIFQHELDHLNGTLIIDHAPLSEKKKILKKSGNFKEI